MGWMRIYAKQVGMYVFGKTMCSLLIQDYYWQHRYSLVVLISFGIVYHLMGGLEES
jgi:hypothetical protein